MSIAIALLLASGICAAFVQEEHAAHDVNPSNLDQVVTRFTFEEIRQHLCLNDSQLVLATAFWTDYRDQINLVNRGVGAELQAVQDEVFADGPLRRDIIDPRRVELRRRWHEISVRARLQSDEILAHFLADLQSILNAEQLDHSSSLPRLIRRLNLEQHPRRFDHGRINAGLTLHQVLDVLRAESASVFDSVESKLDSDSAVDRSDFDRLLLDVIERYEQAFDSVVLDDLKHARAPDRSPPVVFAPGDDEWKRIYGSMARRVQCLLSASTECRTLFVSTWGENADELWDSTFEPMFAPTMYREFAPEQIMAKVHDSFPPNLAANVETQFVAYSTTLQRLREEVVSRAVAELVTKARIDAEVIMSDEQLDLARAVYNLRELVREASENLINALPVENRHTMRSFVAGLAESDPTVMGPGLGLDEYESVTGIPASGWVPPRINTEEEGDVP